MKRAHGFKHQHREPWLKKTISETTAGPAKDNHQASINFKLNKAAYKDIVRPILEYGSSLCDSYYDGLNDELERV